MTYGALILCVLMGALPLTDCVFLNFLSALCYSESVPQILTGRRLIPHTCSLQMLCGPLLEAFSTAILNCFPPGTTQSVVVVYKSYFGG